MFQKLYTHVIQMYSDQYDESKIFNVNLVVLFIVANCIWNFLYSGMLFFLGAYEMAMIALLIGILNLLAIYCSLILTKIIVSQYILVVTVCFYVAATSYLLGYNSNAYALLIPLLFAIYTFSTFNKSSYRVLDLIIILTYVLVIYFESARIYTDSSILQFVEVMNFILGVMTLIFIMYTKSLSIHFAKVYRENRIAILEKQINLDFLTCLYNRKYMEEFLKKEKKQLNSYVIIADIDFFKKVNDTYGHVVGDYILKEVAQKMKYHFRSTDYIARWGGEEFLIYLKNVKSYEAMKNLNTLRQNIMNYVFCFEENEIKITVTFGAKRIEYDMDIMKNIECADKSLYYGKNNGRNQVVFYSDILEKV